MRTCAGWKLHADIPAACHPPCCPSLLVQYENLYCVLRGKKIFHLLPPTELYRMSLQRYPAARYEAQVGYGWGLKLSYFSMQTVAALCVS
jgi:hypothetical protein